RFKAAIKGLVAQDFASLKANRIRMQSPKSDSPPRPNCVGLSMHRARLAVTWARGVWAHTFCERFCRWEEEGHGNLHLDEARRAHRARAHGRGRGERAKRGELEDMGHQLRPAVSRRASARAAGNGEGT